MVKKIVTLFTLLLLITGCYELSEIQTSEQSGDIYFSVSKNVLESRNADSYVLSDLSVAKDDCDKDCVIWTIVKKTDNNQPATQNINTLPVKYGVVLKDMKVTVMPLELSPGKYTVAATVGYVNKGKIVGGGLVHGRFELFHNQNDSSLALKK